MPSACYIPRMKLRILVLVLVAFAPLLAQQKATKPNFTGTWRSVAPPSEAGQVQMVEHTATELRLRHASEGGGHDLRYVLDGKPHSTDSGKGFVAVDTASETPTGVRIVTSTSYSNGNKLEMTQSWALNAKGQIEIQFSQSQNGAAPTKMVIVYEKQPEGRN